MSAGGGPRAGLSTFPRIEWWTDGPQMVRAAHTWISCFEMTFERSLVA